MRNSVEQVAQAGVTRNAATNDAHPADSQGADEEAAEKLLRDRGIVRNARRWLDHWALQWIMLALGTVALAWAMRGGPPPAPIGPAGAPRALQPGAQGSVSDADQVLAIATAPQQFKAFSPDEAMAENDKLPFSKDPVEIARPFLLSRLDPQQYLYARACLAAAIYYEARNEPLRGREAVAQVVLNRVRHAAFPKSVCGVVFQGAERATGCQFTFTCDGSMLRQPAEPAWSAANLVADAALTGHVEPMVGWSTHYHTQWVVPLWAPTLRKTALIGAHYFYRLPRELSGSRAFAELRWALEVPAPAILRLLPPQPASSPTGLPEPLPSPAAEAAAGLKDLPPPGPGDIGAQHVVRSSPSSPSAPEPADTSRAPETEVSKAPATPPRRRGTLPM